MSATAGMFLLTGTQTVLAANTNRQKAGAARAQGAFESAADERNAQIADLQSADAIARGEIAAGVRGAQTRQAVGASRAAMGAQGLRLDVGSPLDVQENEARLGALDVATIRNNAAREAWGFSTSAESYRLQGKVARSAAEQTAMGYATDTLNTLLTGVGKTYGVYRQKRS
ncbi:MAG TPA: hypothetical protein VF787_03320 [Thermoanaerobaculia bacterium]